DRNNSFQKGGGRGGPSHTIFVRGFDRSLGEDEIRSALQDHFSSCGDVTRVSIPKDYETGNIKGMAYMDFKDSDSFNKALELNGSELSGEYLTVDEAKPRGDSRDGGGSARGGWSGGRSGGGRSGGRSGGWSGGDGRGGGGRFGGRGGRGGDRGGRGGRGGRG
ncbi:Nucleolin 2, partial [Cucurbita argyrosperma subsp. argyrosperma]